MTSVRACRTRRSRRSSGGARKSLPQRSRLRCRRRDRALLIGVPRNVRRRIAIDIVITYFEMLDDGQPILVREQRTDAALCRRVAILPLLVSRTELMAGVVIAVLGGVELPVRRADVGETELDGVELAAADAELLRTIFDGRKQVVNRRHRTVVEERW